ncbi:MAG: hypothetical protein H5U08_11940, partial [Thermogutta sp.]|nr:hypothetical protein [Thermogutta sp.]
MRPFARLGSILVVALVCAGCPKPQTAPQGEEQKPPAAAETKASQPTVTVDPALVKKLEERVTQLNGKLERDANGNPVTVDLFQRQTTDQDLALIAQIPTIQRLSLWGADITDAGIQELTKLPDLQVLVLENTSITNDGMKFLGQIKSLRSLN